MINNLYNFYGKLQNDIEVEIHIFENSLKKGKF